MLGILPEKTTIPFFNEISPHVVGMSLKLPDTCDFTDVITIAENLDNLLDPKKLSNNPVKIVSSTNEKRIDIHCPKIRRVILAALDILADKHLPAELTAESKKEAQYAESTFRTGWGDENIPWSERIAYTGTGISRGGNHSTPRPLTLPHNKESD